MLPSSLLLRVPHPQEILFRGLQWNHTGYFLASSTLQGYCEAKKGDAVNATLNSSVYDYY